MSEILIEKYNEARPALFKKEQKLLLDSLSIPVKVHHIGSTSIPGLGAKPIIDILLEVDEFDALDRASIVFESLGYECMGEFGIPDRRYFRKGGERRTHHVHAFIRGSIGAHRHLAFRDYLRCHAEVANEYDAFKRLVAGTCNGSSDVYCDGKAEFVSTHERRALEWAAIRI
ncbi:MAG: GrpB family protein [Pseudohongiellaceae bacterium]|nr:GrpB family protein [Pseudohongiellaceae bacterium]